jgi:hypothetical protein
MNRFCKCGHLMREHFSSDGVCLVVDCPCLGFEDPDEEVEEAEAEEPEDQRLRREGWATLPGLEG